MPQDKPYSVALVSTFKTQEIEQHVLRHTLNRKTTAAKVTKCKINNKNAAKKLRKLESEVDCILPNGVEANILCAKYLQGSSKLFVCDPEVYKQLDDKSEFINLDLPPQISQIPTLTMKDVTIEELIFFVNTLGNYKKFILKPNGKEGGAGQHVFSAKKMITIDISKFQNHILQPYLERIAISGFLFCALNGEMIAWQVSSPERDLVPSAYTKGFHTKIISDRQDEDVRIMYNYVKQCVRELAISGIMEFEFVKDLTTGEHYILEVNPRITGNLLDRDRSWNSPYAEEIVLPYIQTVLNIDPFEPKPIYNYYRDNCVYVDPDHSTAWSKSSPYKQKLPEELQDPVSPRRSGKTTCKRVKKQRKVTTKKKLKRNKSGKKVRRRKK